MERLKNLDDLKNLRLLLKEEIFRPDMHRVKVCTGTACLASGSRKVVEEFEIAKGKGYELDIVKTGCQGLCQKGPVMKVEPEGYFYQKVKGNDVSDIISGTVSVGQPVRKLLYRGSVVEEPYELMDDLPFYKKQVRIALRNNGRIDPNNIYHFIAVGGYRALEKVFSSMTPEEVLEVVKKANLRGRGGAGFPAGIKWEHCKKAAGKIKLVIANGDEGDPGAFMDRSIDGRRPP